MEASPDRERELREQAQLEVRKKRDFVNHAITYVVVNLLALLIWALTGGGFFWPGFILAAWGIVLALNGWDVYLRKPISEDQIEREAERLRQGANR